MSSSFWPARRISTAALPWPSSSPIFARAGDSVIARSAVGSSRPANTVASQGLKTTCNAPASLARESHASWTGLGSRSSLAGSETSTSSKATFVGGAATFSSTSDRLTAASFSSAGRSWR
ncbi:MAG: hypothetical protein NTW96_23550 [Planctomycetia bacterium]|nr:hypothetical protein [Planctomycetia bacterium]